MPRPLRGSAGSPSETQNPHVIRPPHLARAPAWTMSAHRSTVHSRSAMGATQHRGRGPSTHAPPWPELGAALTAARWPAEPDGSASSWGRAVLSLAKKL